eukprot:445053-Rhodomonas_salina.3
MVMEVMMMPAQLVLLGRMLLFLCVCLRWCRGHRHAVHHSRSPLSTHTDCITARARRTASRRPHNIMATISDEGRRASLRAGGYAPGL